MAQDSSSTRIPASLNHLVVGHGSMEKDELRETFLSSRIIGATTAGVRALASQLLTFYVRVPVKLFRPTRVDYLAIPRAINPIYKEKPWSIFTHSGPALLVHSVKKYGWSFIPNHVLPPLIANSAVGLVLYSTYLTSLTIIQKEHEHERKLHKDDPEYNLPGHNPSSIMVDSFYSGMIAGAAQSLAAAPIDAIVTRFSASELLQSEHKTMWSYGLAKLREIGTRGVFAGYSLSLIKESLGFGLFFSTFETVKGPWYRTYVNFFHSGEPSSATRALYPSFILLSGALSAIAVQSVQYPLGKVQKLYLMRLEALDQLAREQKLAAEKLAKNPPPPPPQPIQTEKFTTRSLFNKIRAWRTSVFSKNTTLNTRHVFTFLKGLLIEGRYSGKDIARFAFDTVIPPHSAFRLYSKAYLHTFTQIRRLAAKDAGGSVLKWLYGGFLRSTIATMPSTSIGLVIFEIMRIRYANPEDGLTDPLIQDEFAPDSV